MAQRVADPAETGEVRVRMSYEDWLACAEESRQSEWVEEEAIFFMPPKTEHAFGSFLLSRLVADYVDLFDLGVVIHAPYEMKLTRRSREPDILFIAKENLARLTPERLVGPADLVIELISDDSVRRDRVEKRDEYAAFGVREYWMFDSRWHRWSADFHQLSDAGTYRAVPLDAAGCYRSLVLPGFWLKPEWFRQDPLPKPAALLKLILADSKNDSASAG